MRQTYWLERVSVTGWGIVMLQPVARGSDGSTGTVKAGVMQVRTNVAGNTPRGHTATCWLLKA